MKNLQATNVVIHYGPRDQAELGRLESFEIEDDAIILVVKPTPSGRKWLEDAWRDTLANRAIDKIGTPEAVAKEEADALIDGIEVEGREEIRQFDERIKREKALETIMDGTGLKECHAVDDAGNPAGGTTRGLGIDIHWQNGPLGRGKDRIAPNGAFVGNVILAALGRLKFYQTTRFSCYQNSEAIRHLQAAVEHLNNRTAAREARGVEGTTEL